MLPVGIASVCKTVSRLWGPTTLGSVEKCELIASPFEHIPATPPLFVDLSGTSPLPLSTERSQLTARRFVHRLCAPADCGIPQIDDTLVTGKLGSTMPTPAKYSPRSANGKAIWDVTRTVATMGVGALTAAAIMNVAPKLFEASYAPSALLALNEQTGQTVRGRSGPKWDPQINPLAIPPGEAQNLPSVRVSDSEVSQKRVGKATNYGGAGDKAHLGGFTRYDGHGVSPYLWRQMMKELGVHSVVDVGCGRGTSTTWFLYQGLDVLCVEGSHDAVTKTLLPDPRSQVVEHDFSRGPYWPAKTYDAVWSVEFLEHVSRQYHYNYMTVFRKAAIIIVTSSRWGGWHHVEIHDDEWWIQKYESYGLRYSDKLTEKAKGWVGDEFNNQTISGMGPDGKPYYAQHVSTSVKVFINPMVASLPQHAHLFPHHGCFEDFPPMKTRPCLAENLETVLPSSFEPIPFKQSKHDEWLVMVREKLNITIG
jgi:SAM-dependent methyltransferase